MPKMKYLWALALVALCVPLLAGAAHAQDSWAVAVDAWVDGDGEDRETLLESYPAGVAWDKTVAVSVTAENDSLIDWNADYDIRALQDGVVVDRWGLTAWPTVGATVAPTETYDFAYSIIGPPITTLAYPVAPLPTDAAAAAPVSGEWVMTNLGTLIETDVAGGDVTLGRYPDLLPWIKVTHEDDENGDPHDVMTLMPGSWALFQIEECAGRAPMIVLGYPDGLFRPTSNVDRASMAVFIRRSMKIDKLWPDPAVWDEEAGEWIFDSTFPDVPYYAPGDVRNNWAVGDIEALVMDEEGPGADVVQGFTDGNYWPTWLVTRGQMAVYVARAKAYVLPTDEELAERYADSLAHACTMNAAANTVTSTAHGRAIDDPIVFGATTGGVTVGTTYYVVAVPTADTFQFATTLAGTPFDITADGSNTWWDPNLWFTDIPVGFWCDGEVYAAVDNDVVKGYADGTYKPAVYVDRATMSVYMYRAFIQTQGTPVVLGGPAVGNTDPSAVSYLGVPTVESDPIFAWVAFDAIRMDTNLASGGTWDIRFNFCEGTGSTLVAATVAQIDPAAITAAKTAAEATGVPYFYVVVTVPGLSTGNYNLRVEVEDEDGTMNELPRTARLSSSAMPPPPNCPVPPDADSPDEWMAAAWDWGDGIREPAGGSLLSAMAEVDGTYYVANLATYPNEDPINCCLGFGDTFVWHDVDPTATALRIEVTYHVVPGLLSCCFANPCEGFEVPLDGATDVPYGWGLSVVDWDDPFTVNWWDDCGDISCPADDDIQNPFLGHPLADTSYQWESTDVANFLSVDGDVAVHFCGGAYESLYIDALTLEYALPPTPQPPTADSPDEWMAATDDPLTPEPDGWGDGDRAPMAGSSLGQMAAKDGVVYRTKLVLYALNDDSTNCCLGCGDTFEWNNVPTDALDLTVSLTYRGEKIADYTCCGNNPCEAWGGSELEPTYAPWPGYGWGRYMVDWDDPWTDCWCAAGVPPGNPASPTEEEVGAFLGHPMTNQSFTWTSTNVANFVLPDPLDPTVGTVAIHFCGQTGGILNIDELTLVYTPGPASPPVWPTCP